MGSHAALRRKVWGLENLCSSQGARSIRGGGGGGGAGPSAAFTLPATPQRREGGSCPSEGFPGLIGMNEG